MKLLLFLLLTCAIFAQDSLWSKITWNLLAKDSAAFIPIKLYVNGFDNWELNYRLVAKDSVFFIDSDGKKILMNGKNKIYLKKVGK